MKTFKFKPNVIATGLAMILAVAVAPQAGTQAGVIFIEPSQAVDEKFADSSWGTGPHDRPASTAENFAAENASDRKPAGLIITGAASNTTASPQAATEGSPFGSQSALTDLIPDRKKGVQEVALIAGDLGYFPKTLFVNQNVPVRMFVTGASLNTLCVMVDAFQVRKQVRTQRIEEITFTPSVPGKYRIHCPINQMEATLVVRD